jgi:hypothetical protein
MIQLSWLVAGTIIGMLIACVLVPPPRKQGSLPQPHDPTTYNTEVGGCVKIVSTEVPCGKESDSMNVIAASLLGKK